MVDSAFNEAAVERLVRRASDALPKESVRTAFAGKRGLAPIMVAVVGALPAMVVVAVSLVLGRPLLLVLAAMVMVGTMALVMTMATATRVVAEVSRELVVFASERGRLEVLARVPKSVEIEVGGSRSWLQVHVADEVLWVSRPAFGGVVARFATTTVDDLPDLG